MPLEWGGRAVPWHVAVEWEPASGLVALMEVDVGCSCEWEAPLCRHFRSLSLEEC